MSKLSSVLFDAVLGVPDLEQAVPKDSTRQP
jgi:hypothetical protein